MDKKAYQPFLAQIFLACCFGLFHHPVSASDIETQICHFANTELNVVLKSIKREISEYQRCLENSLGCSVCQWLKKNTSKGKHVATRKEQLIEMLSILANPCGSDAQKIKAIWTFLGTIKAFAQFRGDAGRNFLDAMERLEQQFFLYQNVIWGRL